MKSVEELEKELNCAHAMIFWKQAEIDRLEKGAIKELKELQDRLKNGIEYDEERNMYFLVWTKREIKRAKKEAKKLMEQLNWRGLVD